jgi:hypothetical protein
MFLAYVAIGCVWGWYCYRNIHDLLPIQYYLSSLVGFLIIEMVASWGETCLQLPPLRLNSCFVQHTIVTSMRMVKAHPPLFSCLSVRDHRVLTPDF